ncbi:MAG: hypothetical protein KKH98_04120 [Spirochaetes bacterium]|nr:hypothetical protein [Spirochaetota bacterium]
MKTLFITVLTSLFFLISIVPSSAQLEKGPSSSQTENEIFTSKNPLVLMDFNYREPVTKYGGMWGIFDFNPHDRNAFCRSSFAKDKDLHKKGYYLKVTYDVDSPQAAFNGVWIKLNGIDLSKFSAISMKVRGDSEKGFTDFFKIELKDKTSKIEYYVEDITDQWKEFILPFEEFEGTVEDIDWKNMIEFIPCVFEDWRFKQKTGRLYIDDIQLIPKEGEKVLLKDIIGNKKKS